MTYLPIFFESAWAASIIPFASQPTFFAMQGFGGYDMRLAFALAVTGATIGQAFNWWLGRLLAKLKPPQQITDAHWQKLVPLFRRYGILLALFSWVPLCNLIVVLNGMAGARLRWVLLLVIIGQAFNYGRYLIPA